MTLTSTRTALLVTLLTGLCLPRPAGAMTEQDRELADAMAYTNHHAMPKVIALCARHRPEDDARFKAVAQTWARVHAVSIERGRIWAEGMARGEGLDAAQLNQLMDRQADAALATKVAQLRGPIGEWCASSLKQIEAHSRTGPVETAPADHAD